MKRPNRYQPLTALLAMGCLFSAIANAQSAAVPASLVGQLSASEWQEIQGQIRRHTTRVSLARSSDDDTLRGLSGPELNATDFVLNQSDYIKASNTDADDQFGYSVALSGRRMVIGAWMEDSDGLGEEGNPTSNTASASGAAYVYERINGVWRYQAYLKASNADAGDNFGRAVDVSGDTIVVGAYLEDSNTTGVNPEQNNSAANSGAAYVFVYENGGWQQQAFLKAFNTGADDRFGESVAISGDTIAVGARREDSSTRGINQASNNSAAESGAVYVFVRNNNVWTQQAFVKASNADAADLFGFGLDIDGDTLVVGGYLDDSAATVVNGSQGNVGSSNSNYGSAYVVRPE